jgi:alkyl hydroperoxide reductase subunit AhpF
MFVNFICDKKMMAKSAQNSYDVLIVGGGPATLGLLTNACKTNR